MIELKLDPTLSSLKEKHWNWFLQNFKVNLKRQCIVYPDDEGKRLLMYLLDEENQHERLKNIIYGNVDELQKVINDIHSNFPTFFDFSKFYNDITNWKQVKFSLPKIGEVTKGTIKSFRIILTQQAINNDLKEILGRHNSKQTKEEIKQIIRKFKKHIENQIKKQEEELEDHKKNRNQLFDKIKEIFNYSKFIDTKFDSWNAYELSKALDVSVCPYCNRSFTHTLKTETGQTRPEFDHFYCQKDHPFLAISLYNLIPCCHICNSNLKGEKDFHKTPHIHPYTDCFNQKAVFRTNLVLNENGTYPLDCLYGQGALDNFQLKIELNSNLTQDTKECVQNNIKTFLLEDIYQNHKDYVSEIIKKTILYNNSHIQELAEQSGLFTSKEEIIQTLIGNYIENAKLCNRVLSKLTKDIWEEFSLEEIWSIK